MMRLCTLLLVLGLALPLCCCMPQFFVDPSKYGYSEGGPKKSESKPCDSHPKRAFGRHGSPSVSSAIRFTVEHSDTKKPVKKVCPGLSYIVKVHFEKESFALLTSSQGEFTEKDPYDERCKNRAVYGPAFNLETKVSKVSNTLQLPCSAEGKVKLKVTASSTSTDNYHHATTSLKVDTKCNQPCKEPGADANTAKDSSTKKTNNTEGTDDAKSTKGTDDTKSTKDAGTDSSDGDDGSLTAPHRLARIAAAREAMCSTKKQGGGKCTKSPLGYSCTHTVKDSKGYTLHWSVGGCFPTNPCTETYRFRNTNISYTEDMIHVAASFRTTGYVAVSFGQRAGTMTSHDVVVGWYREGHATVEAHAVSGYSVSPQDMYKDSAQMLVFSGAIEEGGNTTICFTRPLKFQAAKYSKVLSTSAPLQMNWAHGSNNEDRLVEHAAGAKGGITLDLGSEQVKTSNRKSHIPLHGMLMLAAWIYLAPIGVLIARHKIFLKDQKLRGLHIWFHLHRVLQMSALILFAGGLFVAYTQLSSPQGELGNIHSKAALVVAGLAGVQLLVALLFRPTPGSSLRRIWNLVHWNLGRITVLAATVNVVIGINLYSRDFKASSTEWMVALWFGLVSFLIIDIILTLKGRTLRQQEERRMQSLAESRDASRSAAFGASTV